MCRAAPRGQQLRVGPGDCCHQTEKWTQVEIGLILSVSGLTSLLGQMPGGALVDWARSERLVAGLAVAAIGVSALAYAVWPIFPIVLCAALLHAVSSCVLGPAIAAISLGLVGRSAISRRLGRNARFASIGTGIAAAVMGTFGYLLSSRIWIFVVEPRRIPCDGCSDDSNNIGACVRTSGRYQPRPVPWCHPEKR